ncbi:serine/threonine-protein kinase [Hyalangium rubrum]|uniref:Serine/threonine-protein kinase n=1 Tax=Hyalangium rubrum TaxID=3103134 RepID=A0ABU5H9T0_9BACT|nr:serine/threonine-protein kinase [Hyalangium sp. s54d21]MDY7230241.1 serine/threonine-protein kinase [Hyalangium sp. s54d21]
MNFLCPACRTPLSGPRTAVATCTGCGVEVDLARVETAPGTARLSPEVDLTGEQLGGMALKRRLGAGGMGTVYEAEGPQGPCAVKVLSALVAAEPAVRARFRREAEALRQIEHPAVVRVLAEGEERGFCWYAMERVEGPDLRAKLAEGPLPAAEVEGLARRVLSALSAAHARGFIHRDVKPSNLLLSREGVKLCDFGIARLEGATTLTASAALIGSLRYMAPEQQRMGRADARSDLYALGLVLHEALAGGIPGERPLPSGVPGRLRTLISKLLAERPEERPQSATAALKLLERSVPVGVLSVGGAAALALVGFLVAVGPWRAEPPVPKALRKDDVPKEAVAKEPEPTEPQKLPEPVLTQKNSLEAPSLLPETKAPPAQRKTLPVKLDTRTPRKKPAKAVELAPSKKL